MKTRIAGCWIAGLLTFLALYSRASADATNTWGFTNTSQYTVSDPAWIRVNEGNDSAELVLQSVNVRHYATNQYNGTGSSFSSLRTRTPASIVLSRSGATYAPMGTIVSRIFGDGTDAQWKFIKPRFSTGKKENSRGGIPLNDTGLRALWRMDDDWNDPVSGLNLTPGAGLNLNGNGRIGTHAGGLFGQGFSAAANGTLGISNAFTISLWIYFTGSVTNGYENHAIAIGRDATSWISLRLGGYYDQSATFWGRGCIALRHLSSFGWLSSGRDEFTEKDEKVWRHIVVTYDSSRAAGDRTKIYKDSVPVIAMSDWLAGSQTGLDTVWLGFRPDGYEAGQPIKGYLDEVALYNRALTAEEVREQYVRVASPVRMQVRSGNMPDLSDASASFTGPTGTTNSYYFGEAALKSNGSMDVTNRYMQCRIELLSDAYGLTSPQINSLEAFASTVSGVDYTFSDYASFVSASSIDFEPKWNDHVFLGTLEQPNGGFYSNVVYESRVFTNASGPVNWNGISWSVGGEQTNDTYGLLALYHSATWVDSVGADQNGSVYGGVTDTRLAKIGTSASVFDGVNGHVGIGNIGALGGVEFWLKDSNPDDGVMTLSSAGGNLACIAITNGHIIATGISNSIPAIYVNGVRDGTKVLPGWNHVAVSFDPVISANAVTAGVVNADFMQGQMDELAIYTRPLTDGEVKDHYVGGRPFVAGDIQMQVRAGNNPTFAGIPFSGPGSTNAYYQNPGGAVLNTNGQYFQYAALLRSDGAHTPALGSVTITYDTPAKTFTDDTADKFLLSVTQASPRVAWYGHPVGLFNMAASGPLTFNAAVDGTVRGLWRFDETNWAGAFTVLDSSSVGRHGSPIGGLQPASDAQVGIRCAEFDGTNDYISLTALSEFGAGDFTATAWFRTAATNMCAVMSTYAGAGHFTVEINGDGTGATVTGRLAFIISDGTTTRVAASVRRDLADNRWHHVAGVRRAGYIHLYVDGERQSSTDCSTVGSVGNGTLLAGKYGTQNTYFKGYVDEVAAFQRAVPDGEIGQLAAAGARTTVAGTYTGPIIDATRPSIWERMRWTPDAPHNVSLTNGDSSLIGNWHLDETAGGIRDAAGIHANGTANGASSALNGRFGLCYSFNGASWISIPDPAPADPDIFSVCGWVYPSTVASLTLMDKRDAAADGYVLGTDANGRPFFTVNGNVTMSDHVLRSDRWTHLAGIYDGRDLYLYVNGVLRSRSPVFGLAVDVANPAILGANYSTGGAFLNGWMDEVALYDRAIGEGEVLDLYRAGAGTLRLQARVANDTNTLVTLPFTGPQTNAANYFTQWYNEDMLGDLPLGQYLQYRVYLSGEDHKYTPKFYGITIDQSSYPNRNPYVEPVTTNGFRFLGRLLGFDHTIVTNAGTEVQYQITGDAGPTPRWFYWGGSQWDQVVGLTVFGANTSTRDAINANILSFYNQLYDEVGGTFRFRAFLHSGGDRQIQVDDVWCRASEGRVVVTFPTGTENGSRSLVTTVPYDITWTSTGKVSNSLVIDLYNNSGSNFVANLATNVANTGVRSNVVISAVAGTSYRIRIWDAADPTVYDWCNGDFSLVEEFHLVRPDGGEYWPIGTTRQVVWDSPAAGVAPVVDLWMTYDGDNWSGNMGAWTRIAMGLTNNLANRNTYNWAIPANDWRLVSESARMAVVPNGIPHPLTGWPGGAKRDFSDANFTNAGIVITYPTLGAGIRNGNFIDIRWTAAGVSSQAIVRLFDGVSWSVLATNACAPGTNNVCNAQLVGRTTNALIEVSSGGLIGLSDPFTLADVNIVAPTGSVNEAVRSHWLISSTNNILWTSSGAGSNVNVKYTTTELGGSWVTITNNFANNDSGLVTNSLAWVVPGPPSGTVTIRVESVTQPDLYAEAAPFSMSGIQVTRPIPSATWDFTATNRLEWLSRDGASLATVDISFNGGVSYEGITNASAYSQNGSNFDYVAFGAVRRPSDQARFRMRQDHQTLPGVTFTDVMDGNFALRGIAMDYPTTGAVINLGRTATNALRWFSALTLEGNVRLYYAGDGVNFTDSILRPDGLSFEFPNTDSGSCSNSYDWNVSRTLRPSTNARVRVVAGGYSAVTRPFTMRGVRITSPAAGESVPIGATKLVQWDFAAVAGNAQASNFVSITGTNGPFAKYGFTTDSQIDFGGVNWTVDPDVDPTTNAVIRMQVYWPAQDSDVVALSQPFTLRGVKITAPSVGTNWSLGTSRQISFISAGMGAGTLANVYYSSNGVDIDLSHPITNNMPVVDGVNAFTWNVENSSALARMPSTNASVVIVSGGFTNKSRAFTMNGVKITTPRVGDVWAVSDGTNDISWVAVGAPGPYMLTYTVYAGTNGLLIYPYSSTVTNSIGASPCQWPMPVESIGNPVTITISGGGFTNESEPFEIVPKPSIRIKSPAAGDFWKVTETNIIEWIRGGDMVNDFRIMAYYADGTSQQLGSDGAFPLNGGIFSYEWKPIPDKLGRARIVVTNLWNTDVHDVTTNLVIAPRFEVNPFTETAYALKPLTFYFTTRGTVTGGVDFYYSVDPNRNPTNWVLVNTEGPMTVANNANLSYNWTLPNHWTSNTWLRVQDHSYTQTFSAAKPGPYDDYGMFPLNYYTVVWNVYDVMTTQHLDRLSVIENIGRSFANLRSPWTNYYPYGKWDSVWYREYFHDKAVLGWEPARSPTNDVMMTRSEIEPDFHVLANFAYDVSNRVFTIHSWLERSGVIIPNPNSSTIRIYRSGGQLIETLTTSTADGNGVFWQAWNVGATETRLGTVFSSTEVFFAKVDVDFSGVTYNAGLTFALRLAAAEEQVAAIQAIVNAATASIISNVATVGSNVLNVASNLTDFRSETRLGISNLLDVGRVTTNLLNRVDANVNAATNALIPRMDFVSNMVSVIGPSVTNTENAVTNMTGVLTNLAAIADSGNARILTRPTTMQYGSTNAILFKTRAGLAAGQVTIEVRTTAQALLPGFPVAMTEVVGGIYQRDITANWGTNSYIITCTEPSANDSIIVTVVGAAGGTIDQVPDMIVGLSNRLNTVDAQLTNIAALVQGIQGADLSSVNTGISSLQSQLTAVQATVGNLRNTDLSQIDLSPLRTIEQRLGTISDNASMSTFFARLSSIESQINSVGTIAGDASKKAQTAKTQASAAASGVQTLKSEIQKGDLVSAMAALRDIKAALDKSNENVRDISKVVRLGDLYNAVNDMSARIDELYKSGGWKSLINMKEPPKGEAGKGANEDAIGTLNRNMDEMRASLVFLQKMMDEMNNKPVIHETLRGAE